MIDLSFQIEGVEVPLYAASPMMMFKLRLADVDATTAIHSVALRCQVRIEPTRRRYEPAEQKQLVDLFGEPERWGQTLRSMLWSHTSAVVPPFIGSTIVELPVQCTYDFNVAAAKYFHALENGEVPLCFLFSGTIFYASEEDGQLQVAQISWERESNFRLPVSVWHEMMERYYPNIAWLCLRKDIFNRLYQYRTANVLPSWEQTIERLLDGVEDSVDESVIGRQDRPGRAV